MTAPIGLDIIAGMSAPWARHLAPHRSLPAMKTARLIISLGLAFGGFSAAISAPEDRPLPEVDGIAANDVDRLISLLQKRGFVVGYQRDLTKWPKFNFSGGEEADPQVFLGKVRKALTSAGYRLDVEDHFAMVAPAEVESWAEGNPLDALVDECGLQNISPSDGIAAIGNAVQIELIHFNWSICPQGVPVTMTLRKVTAREAFFKIAEAGGFTGWAVNISRAKRGKLVTVFNFTW